MYIGITGLYCSGKDSMAKFLVNMGFGHFSLSDVIRNDLRKEGQEITRDNLIKRGNELRRDFGLGVLAKKVVEIIEKNDLNNVVITSIRHPAEIEELQKLGNFFLVSVDSPIEIRFKRAFDREREFDPRSFKDFVKKENSERKGKGVQQQIDACIKRAKIHILNQGTFEELQGKVEKLFEDLKKKIGRPSWDEYFMQIAKAVAKRATCDRGRNGCVIVKDKKILATGYVGSPIGMEHCDEVGHLFETRYDINGKKSEHCIRTTHAEQNAIAQAARYGIPIDGATIYVKMEPCLWCTKQIINSGIKRVVCEKRYHVAELSRQFLKEAGVKLEALREDIEKYEKQ
jgi:dCMP deaminase